jgi:hypothetical protein
MNNISLIKRFAARQNYANNCGTVRALWLGWAYLTIWPKKCRTPHHAHRNRLQNLYHISHRKKWALELPADES